MLFSPSTSSFLLVESLSEIESSPLRTLCLAPHLLWLLVSPQYTHTPLPGSLPASAPNPSQMQSCLCNLQTVDSSFAALNLSFLIYNSGIAISLCRAAVCIPQKNACKALCMILAHGSYFQRFLPSSAAIGMISSSEPLKLVRLHTEPSKWSYNLKATN